jgi:large subunit ribosomal protein L9
MKVILLENVKRIGSIGEVIDVKRGFARNFLIATKKLFMLQKKILKKLKKLNLIYLKKIMKKKLEAQKISEQVNNKEYVVKKLSTENNELYGSVKPTEIAKLIQDTNKIDIKPSMIQPVQEIKALGKHKVKISLHSSVMLRLQLMFSLLKQFSNYTISSTVLFLNF